MHRLALPALALAAVAALAAGCATNPVTGRSDLAFMSEANEKRIGQQMHVQITQVMGVYDDPRLQEYVQQLGEKLAKQSHRPDLDWKFTVVDTDDVNAFATPGGFVYVSRGLLPYLASEAELAAVLGHEIGHITARHSVQRQSQSTVAGVLGVAAAIFTGQPAVADLTSIAGQAVISGYGREQELEADRLGAEYLVRTGYDPEAIIRVVRVLKEQELFERDRARAEGRSPRIYHGVFSTHPDNDRRLREAVVAAEKVEGRAATRHDNAEAFLQRIDGLAFGSSRRQGMVRDNRFYHADFQFTMAFPQGWQVQNDPNRLLAVSPDRHHIMQLTAQAPPAGLTNPRDFTLRALGDRRLDRSENLTINGLDAFTTIVRGDTSPFGNTSNVRYVVIHYNNLMWILKGASRAGTPAPEGDVLFTSTARTFRQLRSDEFRLAEPNRLRIVRAQPGTTMQDLATRSPLTRYAVEQHRLFNGLYPSGEPEPGALVKVVR